MPLTQSQQEAVAAFKEFLKGSAQVFILKGAAGTGKTTLVKEFRKLLDNKEQTSELMAPTGRAAHILGSSLGVSARTIHRTIYSLTSLRSNSANNEEEDDDSMHARFGLRENRSPQQMVYFVDEASMISDTFADNEAFSFGSGRLLHDLFAYANGRKIVFIGDYAQLPPVGMSFSPALDSEYLRTNFKCEVREYVLREVLRQQGDGVMLANATKIRDCIEEGIFIEFSLDDGPDSAAANDGLLAPYYALSSDKPSVKAAVIVHSNAGALNYNQSIRRHYYGNDAPRLVKGDLLMIARNNYAFQHELFNGSIVKVEECQGDHELQERSVGIRINGERNEKVTLRFRNASIKFITNGKKVQLNVKLLDNVIDDPSGSLTGIVARALYIDFENRLPKEIKDKKREIRKILNSGHPLPENLKVIHDDYNKRLLTDPYYNALICKYGYAMTCHKAQGGEWENVFVDMSRIGGTANEEYFRWAYTALTRASKKVWHYMAPNFNFLSNMMIGEIQLSPKLKASIYGNDDDFCTARLERIRRICEPKGISVTDDRSRNYQHWLTFTAPDNKLFTINLWYGAGGYSLRREVRASTSQEFAEQCREILDVSFAPDDVPFDDPDRPLATRLAELIKARLADHGIGLLNITHEHYQDIFHLKTNGLARIAMYYNDKGNYTSMKFLSTLGADDHKLETFRQRFI